MVKIVVFLVYSVKLKNISLKKTKEKQDKYPYLNCKVKGTFWI